MATCTIKGKEYALGDIAGTKENFAIIGALMGMSEGSDYSTLMPEARRVLEEAIRAGSGAKAATKAMADLTVKITPGSDFLNGVLALVKSVVE